VYGLTSCLRHFGLVDEICKQYKYTVPADTRQSDMYFGVCLCCSQFRVSIDDIMSLPVSHTGVVDLVLILYLWHRFYSSSLVYVKVFLVFLFLKILLLSLWLDVFVLT